MANKIKGKCSLSYMPLAKSEVRGGLDGCIVIVLTCACAHAHISHKVYICVGFGSAAACAAGTKWARFAPTVLCGRG